MAAIDATIIPIKNQAFRVMFPILDADGDLVTGAAALDSEISKDCAAMADCTNEATEITGSGMYYLDLTATEMNADSIVIVVKTTTTDAKTTPMVLYPAENGDIPVDVTMVSGDATAADNLEADYDGTGYNKSASTVGTVTTNTDMRGNDSANTVIPDPAGTSPTVVEIREEMDLNSTQLIAIKAKTDLIGEGIAKGVAFNAFSFSMFDLNGNPATGLTVALYISKDGGSFTIATNAVSEVGMGFYKIDFTAIEMDANVIALGATATGAGQGSISIVTE